MSTPQRIGVLGGTFDPIHKAHIALASAAMQQANLDRVLFVVAACPPHKRGYVRLDAEQRYELVQAALAGEPGLEPSRIELDREGPSYTADTLAQLQEQHPGSELFLILGMDAVHDLPRWHQPEMILHRAHILAAVRPGFSGPLPEMMAGRTELLTFEPWPVSSRVIRAQLESGEMPAVLPAAVWQRIQEKGWYAQRRQPTRA